MPSVVRGQQPQWGRRRLRESGSCPRRWLGRGKPYTTSDAGRRRTYWSYTTRGHKVSAGSGMGLLIDCPSAQWQEPTQQNRTGTSAFLE